MHYSIIGARFHWPSPLSLASATLALMLAACSSWPASAPTATPTPSTACPSAQARYLTCSNGVKMLSYEPGFELARFCEPLQQLEGKIGGVDRRQPLYALAGGERAMLIGAAGWLLLPREADLSDVPQSMAAWWNNRACTLPTALRP
jgi:hypothetical protein